MKTFKIAIVAGTRPNLVKVSSILKACQRKSAIETIFIHTGQHYSYDMSQSFIEDLEIPFPDINLEIGSVSHVLQISEIMRKIEKIFIETNPNIVIVVGDVNSTVASAIAAVKMGIVTVHVEAGLRSFDRSMPEEINRIITDSISNIFFVSEQSGIDNLRKEGIYHEHVYLVGNVMIDTLYRNKTKAEKSIILEKLGLYEKKYCVVTLHRPSNVDKKTDFIKIIDAIIEIQKNVEVIFPVHPRTLKNIEDMDLKQKMLSANIKIVDTV